MRKTPLYFIFVFFLLLYLAMPVRSDIVKIIEGSMLIGKIIEEDKEKLIFSNAHGTFRIKMIHIVDIYRTKNYREDITFLKKMNAEMNEKVVKINVEAGQKKLSKMKNESIEKNIKSGSRWVHGRICVSGTYYYIPGKVGEVLPGGFSGHVSLDQGLDMAMTKHHPMVPGLRFEGAYIHLRNGSFSITGYSGGGGLMWAMPSMNNKGGCFVLALMPGVSWLDIKNREARKSAKSLTFSASAIAGYQVSFGVFSMFIHARYTYIYDRDVLFHTVGGECGFGFNAW